MPMHSPLLVSTGIQIALRPSTCSALEPLLKFCPLLELYPQFGNVLFLFCGRIPFEPEADSADSTLVPEVFMNCIPPHRSYLRNTAGGAGRCCNCWGWGSWNLTELVPITSPNCPQAVLFAPLQPQIFPDHLNIARLRNDIPPQSNNNIALHGQ